MGRVLENPLSRGSNFFFEKLRQYNFLFLYCLQAIHQQMQEALEEQESLKIQIAEYARQVARVEELLAQKVSSLAYVALSKAIICLHWFSIACQSE